MCVAVRVAAHRRSGCAPAASRRRPRWRSPRAPCRRCRRFRSGTSSPRGARAACRALPAAARTAAASTPSRSGRSRRNRRARECARRAPRPADGCASSPESTHPRGAAATSASGVSVATRVDVVRHRSRETRRRAYRPTGRGSRCRPARGPPRDRRARRRTARSRNRARARRRRTLRVRRGRRASASPRRAVAAEQRCARASRPRHRASASPACRSATSPSRPGALAGASPRTGDDDRAIDAAPRAIARRRREPVRVVAVHRLEQQLRESAAALPEARAQRKAVQRAAARAAARRSRAMSIALCSRWPPPIVPSIASAVTIIRVPGGRGTDPFAATTLTRIASRPRRTSRRQRADPVVHRTASGCGRAHGVRSPSGWIRRSPARRAAD